MWVGKIWSSGQIQPDNWLYPACKQSAPKSWELAHVEPAALVAVSLVDLGECSNPQWEPASSVHSWYRCPPGIASSMRGRSWCKLWTGPGCCESGHAVAVGWFGVGNGEREMQPCPLPAHDKQWQLSRSHCWDLVVALAPPPSHCQSPSRCRCLVPVPADCRCHQRCPGPLFYRQKAGIFA